MLHADSTPMTRASSPGLSSRRRHSTGVFVAAQFISRSTPSALSGSYEANFLKLDCSKLKTTFGWKPRWNFDTAIEKSVEWSKVYAAGGDVVACMDKEIEEFFA